MKRFTFELRASFLLESSKRGSRSARITASLRAIENSSMSDNSRASILAWFVRSSWIRSARFNLSAASLATFACAAFSTLWRYRLLVPILAHAFNPTISTTPARILVIPFELSHNTVRSSVFFLHVYCPFIFCGRSVAFTNPPCTGTTPDFRTTPVFPSRRTKLATTPPIWKKGMPPRNIHIFFFV